MESNIQFVNEKIKEAFEKLKYDDSKMHKFIERALSDIKRDDFCEYRFLRN